VKWFLACFFVFSFCVVGDAATHTAGPALSNTVLAVPTRSSLVTQPSVTFMIYESLVNDLLTAMGPISGTTTVNIPMVAGQAQWTIKNAKIAFLDKDSSFSANVEVKCGLFGTNSVAKGSLVVTYNVTSNMIQITPKNAFVDLFFDVMGQKITFARLDMATFYKKPLAFSGPPLLKSGVSVPLPGGKTKQLALVPQQTKIVFMPRALDVSLWLKPK
jgi:hypothetical protein